jgi:hypothetical protein
MAGGTNGVGPPLSHSEDLVFWDFGNSPVICSGHS